MSGAALRFTVRKERDSDLPFVRDVVEAAFGRALEAGILDGVRGTPDWFADGSLVAADGDGRVIGHVLLSRGMLAASDGTVTEIGLIGPVAVWPELQRRGVGDGLMRAAISAATARHLPVICLVGHPSYYPRFGFQPARALGIEPVVEDWPDAAWMVLRLPGWMPSLRGVVHFPPAFGAH